MDHLILKIKREREAPVLAAMREHAKSEGRWNTDHEREYQERMAVLQPKRGRGK